MTVRDRLRNPDEIATPRSGGDRNDGKRETRGLYREKSDYR